MDFEVSYPRFSAMCIYDLWRGIEKQCPVRNLIATKSTLTGTSWSEYLPLPPFPFFILCLKSPDISGGAMRDAQGYPGVISTCPVKAHRQDVLGVLCSQLIVPTAFLSGCTASQDLAATCSDAGRVFPSL